MLLQLPPRDEAAEERLFQLRADLATAQARLADAEYASAAWTLRRLWGDNAETLIVRGDYTDDDSIYFTPLILLDRNDEPIWFDKDRDECWEYPGVGVIVKDDNTGPVTDMDDQVIHALTDRLLGGYEIAGTGLAFFHVDDELLAGNSDEPPPILALRISIALG